MRILLVSDAWSPQVNGVVRTLQRVRQECEGLGHQVEVISPECRPPSKKAAGICRHMCGFAATGPRRARK